MTSNMMRALQPWLTAFCLFGFFSFVHAKTSLGLAEKFNADRAFDHVRKQVDFGPRPSGSAALAQTREYLGAELRSYGLNVSEQAFTEETPRGAIRFVNILADPPGSFSSSLWERKKPSILIASHYDTKWLPDVRFVGANDGASGVAVLIEIARVIAVSRFHPPDLRIEFALFDGEECVKEYASGDGLHGSRYHVRQLKSKSRDGKIAQLRGMILLDMVGDRDLSIQIPDGDPDFTRRVFEASKALGFREFFHSSPRPIIDDHVPFVQEGTPAIDLIDFEYGPGNRWWHSPEDTLDKLSPQSLKIVGQTVLKMLECLGDR